MSGFEKQTYTQVPNSLFEVMAKMDECELKVILYICRYTFGYHRDTVKISTRKMSDAIGMSTNSVQKGAEAAEKRGLIEKISDGQSTTEWKAVVESVSEIDTPKKKVYQNLIHPVSEFDTQVGIKESINKDTDILKEKGISVFQKAAMNVFGKLDFQSWRKLENELSADNVSISVITEDNPEIIQVSGLGIKSSMFQDRYALSFERAFMGIFNHPVAVTFME